MAEPTANPDVPQLGEVVDAPIEYLENQNILTWMKEQAMQEKVLIKQFFMMLLFINQAELILDRDLIFT
jgi:hypothetical protein